MEHQKSVFTALVVNGSQVYNLATVRLTAWLQQNGGRVQVYQAPAGPGDMELLAADRLYLSALFSWDLPALLEIAGRAQRWGLPVEIGGPAAEFNAAWIAEQTGIEPWRGVHPCAAVPLENPRMTWTSRGCPARCPFCQVWRVEGALVELDDWQPAPLVMDNNFLACSPGHQERTLRKLVAAGYRRIDFNQGLDARLYTPGFRQLLERCDIRLRYWRFACDQAEEWPAVERALRDLQAAGIPWAAIRIYLLYNYTDSPEEAAARAELLIGSRDRPLACPWPMAYRPLDWMQADDYVAPGWTLRQVRDFRRYYSRPRIWRSSSWQDYDRRRPRGVPSGYSADWNEIAARIKSEAGWRCEQCGHPHAPEAGYTLTVHHIDGHPGHNARSNLVALCQRCHLAVQQAGAIQPGQLPLWPEMVPPWTRR